MEPKTLSESLADLEKRDPEVKKAREDYDRMTKEILDTPSFREENLVSTPKLMMKLAKHQNDDNEPATLSPAEVRTICVQLWRAQKKARDANVRAYQYMNDWTEAKHEFGVNMGKTAKALREAKAVLRGLFTGDDLACRWDPPCDEVDEKTRENREGCYRCRARILLDLTIEKQPVKEEEMEDGKKATIQGVTCGVHPNSRKFALWFRAQIEGSNKATTVIIPSGAVAQFVESFGVESITHLNGRIVNVMIDQQSGNIRYTGPAPKESVR